MDTDSSVQARVLQATGNFSDYADSFALFFGLQGVFFVAIPSMILLWRLLLNWRHAGFMVMFKAPLGRVGDKRSPASALRFFLFQETSLGYWADVAQVSVCVQTCFLLGV